MTDTARAWRASRPGRPRSLNAERSAHWREHRRATAEERKEWGWLWKEQARSGVRLASVMCVLDSSADDTYGRPAA